MRLWYQTNGMGSAWWSVPAEASIQANHQPTSTNHQLSTTNSHLPTTNYHLPSTNYQLRATFPPSADPGAERLTVFFGAPSNAYAAAQVRFRNSPGPAPNVLPPPETIDWMSELSSATNALWESCTATFMPQTNAYTKAEVDALIQGGGSSSGGDWQIVTNSYTIATNAYTIATNGLTRQEAESGFTEWTMFSGRNVSGMRPYSGWFEISFDVGDGCWIVQTGTPESPSERILEYETDPDATELTWTVEIGLLTFYKASRIRVPTMADLAGKAPTNDVHLTPVYSSVAAFSDWAYSGESAAVEVVGQPTFHVDPNDGGTYYTFNIFLNGAADVIIADGGVDDTVIRVENDGDDSNISFTATRVRTDIIGYTLGSQTNDVLAATNSIISASITNGFVNASITNGLVSASITNGLATTSFVERSIADIPAPMVSNIWFTTQDNELNFAPTEFRIDTSKDWFSLKFPGFTTFYYPNSNQVNTAISRGISSADTSYPRYTTITNLNQSVQYLNITDTAPSTLAILFPTNGVTKDWIVYITTVTNVSLTLPSATYWMADTAYTNDVPPAPPTALCFSQIADGIFYLGRQSLTEVTP